MRELWERFRGWIAALAAGTAVVGGGAMMLGVTSLDLNIGTPAPAPVVANAWVDTTGGTCAFSTTPAEYSDAAACSSTSAAYAAANSASSSASTVRVRAGSYGSQSIPDSTRTGGTITFRNDGGDVVFNSLSVNGDKTAWIGDRPCGAWDASSTCAITFSNGLNIIGSTTRQKEAAFTDTSAHGADGVGALYIQNAEDLSFYGGDIGNGQSLNSDTAEGVRTAGGNLSTASARILIDGALIHDWDRETSGTHSECMLMVAVQGLTIRNSKFRNCTVYNISLARIGSDADPKDTLIENNVFGPTDDLTPGDQDGIYSVVLAHCTDEFENLTFRNNTFHQGVQLDATDTDSACFASTRFDSNILHDQGSCAPGGFTVPAYTYNVVDSTCQGSNATVVADTHDLWTVGSGASSALDARLKSGSPAIGAGSPTNSSATDALGCSRGGDPDAGAFQFGVSC